MKGRSRRRTRPLATRPANEPVLRTLVRAFGLMRRAMAPHFARFGISASQWGVLRVLDRARAEGIGALRLGDMSTRLLVQPPSVTGVVERLRRMGLIESSVARADQRAREVSLTAAGRRRVREVLRNHPARVKQMLAGLDPREQRQLRDLLARLSSHLQRIVEPGADPGNGAS
jgi:DNA-binding MarR family transcriptional regulator